MKTCTSCNSAKPRPERSRVSGLRAEEVGELIYLDHGSAKNGKQNLRIPDYFCVSILSCTQTRVSRTRTRTRPSHNLKTPTNTTTGWLFASGSSWTLGHTGGSRQDTHSTSVPEREGRGWLTRDDFRQTTQTSVKTNVLSARQVLILLARC